MLTSLMNLENSSIRTRDPKLFPCRVYIPACSQIVYEPAHIYAYRCELLVSFLRIQVFQSLSGENDKAHTSVCVSLNHEISTK